MGQESHHSQGASHARLHHRRHRPDRLRRRRRAARATATPSSRSPAPTPPPRPLEAAGAQTVRGGLADLDVLRAGRRRRPTASSTSPSATTSAAPRPWRAAVAEETAALTTLGEELVGSDRPLVTVSGTPWVPGRASTEADPLPTEGPVGGRGRTVTAILGLASHGVRSSAVRLPRTVHNDGEGGFAGLLTDIARQSGVSGYPGDGTQRWPAVHALDAAVLFRLALEQAPAGTAWHAVADEGDAVRDIAAVIGRRLGLPVESVPGRPSARSAPSSRPTSPPRAPTPGRRWAGSRRTRACSRTWRTSSPDASPEQGWTRGRRTASRGDGSGTVDIRMPKRVSTGNADYAAIHVHTNRRSRHGSSCLRRSGSPRDAACGARRCRQPYHIEKVVATAAAAGIRQVALLSSVSVLDPDADHPVPS